VKQKRRKIRAENFSQSREKATQGEMINGAKCAEAISTESEREKIEKQLI
jgi:hypothetical protein